ncbi:hypothetical protein [Shewanella woodyi]|uniref:hypothetical protein n=1 Tax=Shewanella woodyi TaxID=60961 RepID=UPI0007F8FC4F|nr:hypothetical protein [Shewanella woodyi]
MPEPITTVGLGAIAAYLGKDGISKILGPTAEYVGGELQAFTKKRIENVGRIFQSAERKLGQDIDSPGAVSPKVLKNIVNEGSYSDDDISVEYFGGVLASSRTDLLRDDRGARIARKIDNLSTYQLRTHYFIYSTIANICKDSGESVHRSEGRANLQIHIPLQGFADSLGLTQKEWDNPQLLHHIFHGLDSDGLIGSTWGFGSVENIKPLAHSQNVNEAGIVCEPSAAGAELFLWGFGHGQKTLDYIFDNEFNSELDGLDSMIIGSTQTKYNNQN